jgi:hypothetical protein
MAGLIQFLRSRFDPLNFTNVSPQEPLPVALYGASAGGGAAGGSPINPPGAPSNAAAVTTQGVPYTGVAAITRAANMTQYSIGDVVGGVLTIANAGPAGGDVLLAGLRLLWNINALPSGMGPFTLHLYNAAPPSAIADNSPWTLGGGDRGVYLDHIDGLTVAALGTGTQTVQGALNEFLGQFKLASGSTSLFAYLVTTAVFTPASNSETGVLTTKGFLP